MTRTHIVMRNSIVFRSSSYDCQDNNSPVHTFHNSMRSSNALNSHTNKSIDRRSTRVYLVNKNGISRLIGKGGANIKQVQREYNAYIQISNDRQHQWIEVKIHGVNEQSIDNVYNHILNHIGEIKEKNPFNQTSQSSFDTSRFDSIVRYNYCFYLDKKSSNNISR
jgi:polyribonucleotide nucleotidyltransferase